MSKIKVAVIEDDDITSKIICEELLEAEFEIFKAFDGVAGVELVKSRMPDIVLLDIMMPKMAGFDVLKSIMSDPKTKNIPVFILTVLSDDESIIKAKELGAKDYIIKTKQKVSEIPGKIKSYLGK